MSVSNKVANEHLRQGFFNLIRQYFSGDGYEVLQYKSNAFCTPCVDETGDEKWAVITVTIPTGADKGREPFDGYAESEDYAHKLREKAVKAQKKAEEKAKKIEHDKKMRAQE